MPIQPPLSVGLTRIARNRLRQDAEIEARAEEAVRQGLDGDEAEAAATRHAEERRVKRETAERGDPHG